MRRTRSIEAGMQGPMQLRRSIGRGNVVAFAPNARRSSLLAPSPSLTSLTIPEVTMTPTAPCTASHSPVTGPC